MIDIHCHILSNIDDGAKNIEDSIAMAKHAVSEGITKIIATPHHKNGQYENRKLDIIPHVDKLNEELSKQSIPLTILPGQETRIYGELLEDYQKGEILTLNNTMKYVFVELPSGHVPRYTEKLLYDIQLNGLVPIIVHPERNSELMENPDMLYQLVKKGALTQVTASSVTGHFGKKVKKFSMKLIESNLTQLIASDAHNVTSRTFRMKEAYGEIEKEFGLDSVYMFQENAELLIDGKTVYKEPPERVKTKKFLGIFG